MSVHELNTADTVGKKMKKEGQIIKVEKEMRYRQGKSLLAEESCIVPYQIQRPIGLEEWSV